MAEIMHPCYVYIYMYVYIYICTYIYIYVHVLFLLAYNKMECPIHIIDMSMFCTCQSYLDWRISVILHNAFRLIPPHLVHDAINTWMILDDFFRHFLLSKNLNIHLSTGISC